LEITSTVFTVLVRTVPTTKLGGRRTGVFGTQEREIVKVRVTKLLVINPGSPAQLRRGYGEDCIAFPSCFFLVISQDSVLLISLSAGGLGMPFPARLGTLTFERDG